MKKYIVLGLFAVVLSGVGGCGGGGPDSLMKEQIATLNEMSAALESVKDDKSADEAIAKIDKSCDKLKDISKKFNELKVSEADKKKLEEANKKAGDEAGERFQKAMKGAAEKAPGKAMAIAGSMLKMAGAMMEGQGKTK